MAVFLLGIESLLTQIMLPFMILIPLMRTFKPAFGQYYHIAVDLDLKQASQSYHSPHPVLARDPPPSADLDYTASNTLRAHDFGLKLCLFLPKRPTSTCANPQILDGEKTLEPRHPRHQLLLHQSVDIGILCGTVLAHGRVHRPIQVPNKQDSDSVVGVLRDQHVGFLLEPVLQRQERNLVRNSPETSFQWCVQAYRTRFIQTRLFQRILRARIEREAQQTGPQYKLVKRNAQVLQAIKPADKNFMIIQPTKAEMEAFQSSLESTPFGSVSSAEKPKIREMLSQETGELGSEPNTVEVRCDVTTETGG